jgi:hypothetical protein
MTFAHWLHEQWYQHAAEIESWTGRPPAYTPKDYFGKYKWWLGREWRRVVKNQQHLTD